MWRIFLTHTHRVEGAGVQVLIEKSCNFSLSVSLCLEHTRYTIKVRTSKHNLVVLKGHVGPQHIKMKPIKRGFFSVSLWVEK